MARNWHREFRSYERGVEAMMGTVEVPKTKKSVVGISVDHKRSEGLRIGFVAIQNDETIETVDNKQSSAPRLRRRGGIGFV
jgi:hypothetical protein